MAFLRFNSETAQVATVDPKSDSPSEKLIVTLTLGQAQLDEIAGALSAINAGEGSELRTEFPDGFTLFWKIRDGESRFFVARPETDQWVATLALSRTHLEAIRAQMTSGTGGPLSALERVSRMSNVEIILSVK